MKISSQLFFKAIIVEFLEEHNFILKQTPIAYIYELGEVKVKVGDKIIHIYEMSQKNDIDKLQASVRYNEYKSLDKVRTTVLNLINNTNIAVDTIDYSEEQSKFNNSLTGKIFTVDIQAVAHPLRFIINDN